ncbi:YgjV family protein [Methylobacterium sp. CM6247]
MTRARIQSAHGSLSKTFGMTFLASWLLIWQMLDLFGLLGLLCGVATGLMPSRRLILLSSALCSVCFSVHFLRLGSTTGMAMNLIGVAQSLLAAHYVTARGYPSWLGATFAATFLLAGALTLSTWNGWPSAFSGLGTLISTAARLQAAPQIMRGLLMGSSLCWAAHNLMVSSVCGLTCDCLGLIGFTLAALREHAASRRAAPGLAAGA